MRWSPCERTRAPRSPAPPSTTRPSGSSRTRAPSAARPSARAAMRSLSLTRSSPAPVIVKDPCAQAAATARAGTSSMSEGTRAGSTVVPCSLDEDATIEPIGSGSLASRRVSTWPPMARSTSTKAVRVGESRTPSRRTSESGRTRAATTRKAALEASPGTTTSAPRRRAPPRTVAARPSRSTVDAEGRQHPLGVVAARARLADGRGRRRPAGRRGGPPSSPARWPPAGRA